jgi:hypothetical protein
MENTSKSMTLQVRSIGYSAKRNRIVFNFSNPETAGLAHGVPAEWFGKKLANFGMFDITAAHLELLVELNGVTAHCNGVSIIPAGSMLEGRDEPTKQDNLDVVDFDFQVKVLPKLQIKKELTPEVLKGMPVLFKSSVTEAEKAEVAKPTVATIAAGISEDEE